MPVTRTGKLTYKEEESFESDRDDMEGQGQNTQRHTYNIPHLTKFSGRHTEDPDRFFLLFEHLATLQGWNEAKQKEILPLYLQEIALDYIFQLKALDQYDKLTFAEIKSKLINIGRPKVPAYRAELEIHQVKQEETEPVESYFIRKLRIIRQNQPEASEEQKIHFLSLGLQKNLMREIALDSYKTVEELQTKLAKITAANDLMKKREFLERHQALNTLYGSSSNIPQILATQPHFPTSYQLNVPTLPQHINYPYAQQMPIISHQKVTFPPQQHSLPLDKPNQSKSYQEDPETTQYKEPQVQISKAAKNEHHNDDYSRLVSQMADLTLLVAKTLPAQQNRQNNSNYKQNNKTNNSSDNNNQKKEQIVVCSYCKKPNHGYSQCRRRKQNQGN
jgi:hypothetical protein